MVEVEEQPQVPYIPGAGVNPGGPSEDFFRFRISGEDILEDIEHQLRGEVYDHEKDRYIQKFDRWVNEEGINKILHVIYSCGINKNTFLGNLSSDQINFKCNKLKKHMALLLFKKYKQYNIKKEMRNLLLDSVINQIHSALSRSEGGKEAQQLSTAAQRIETFTHQDKPKRSLPSPFSLFKR